MKIKFIPTNIEVEGDPNKSLLQICAENHIEINSICKGVPKCAECRVRIVDGDHNLVPPSSAELNLIGTNYYLDQRRLSCQVHAFGPITVDLTEQIERSEIQNKKVRGFKSHTQRTETQAVQGTLVLQEKTEVTPEVPAARPQRNQGRGNNQPRNNQGGGQGRNQNRPQGGRGGNNQNKKG